MKTLHPPTRSASRSVRFSRLAVLALSQGLALLLFAGRLSATEIPGSFRPIPLQGGGWVTGLAVKNLSPSFSYMYARTDVGGLYRSTDGGANWTFLSGDMATPGALGVQGVAIGRLPYTVFQATGNSQTSNDAGNGVWRSTDSGNTWTQVLPNVAFLGNNELSHGGECIAVKLNGTNPETVWAGSCRQGLWRSNNAGNTWAQVGASTFNSSTSTPFLTSICLDPARPNEIWVGGDTGLYVSTNDGTDWTFLPLVRDSGNQPIAYKVWRVMRLADGTALVSITNGKSTDKWHNEGTAYYLYKVTATNWSSPSTYSYTDITANFVPADGRTPVASNSPITTLAVLAGTVGTHDHAGKLLVKNVQSNPWVVDTTTSNWGWTEIAATLAPQSASNPWPKWAPSSAGINPCNKITQDPYNFNRWYSNQGFGMSVSDHVSASVLTGMQWKAIDSGLAEVVGQPPTFDPNNPLRVYLPVGDHGAATIVDGGIKADGTPNPVPNAMISGYYNWPDGHAFSFRVLQDNTGKAYVFGGLFDNSTNTAKTPNGRLWTTTDQGGQWNLEIPYVVDSHPAGQPPVVTSRGTQTGLPVGPVTVPATNPTLVSGTFEDAVATSDDMSSYVVASTGPANLTGLGAGGIYYTTNGQAGADKRFTQAVVGGGAFPLDGLTVGEEWGNYAQFERDSADPKTIYLAFTAKGGDAWHGAGLYRSTGDANNPTGKIWTTLTHPSQTVTIQGTTTYGWVGHNYQLAVDSNPNSSGTNGIPRLWVAGDDVTIGLKYSNDRGVSWNVASGFIAAQDVSARDGVICVLGERTGDVANRIYLSQDNGSTWNEITRQDHRFPKAARVSLSPHVPGQVWITSGGCSYTVFTPDTTARNLLTNASDTAHPANPSFESNLDNWGYNAANVTTVADGGIFGIKVARIGSSVNGGLTRTETLASPLPKKIKLVFWAKPSAYSGYNLSASLKLKNAAGTDREIQSVSVGGSTEWKRYETAVIDVSSYPDAAKAEILFWKTGSTNPITTVDIDHVQLLSVPIFVP